MLPALALEPRAGRARIVRVLQVVVARVVFGCAAMCLSGSCGDGGAMNAVSMGVGSRRQTIAVASLVNKNLV